MKLKFTCMRSRIKSLVIYGGAFLLILASNVFAHSTRQEPHPEPKYNIDISDLVEEANIFLGTLTNSETNLLSYPIDSKQWKIWSNFNQSSSRVGLRLGDLNTLAKERLFSLFRTAFSEKGIKNVNSIMKLNNVLGLIKNEPNRFSEDDYYFVMFGKPSLNMPWGFQFEGHHLAVHYFVQENKVAMSPVFFGAEPTVTPPTLKVGKKYKTLTVLAEEKLNAKTLVDSLTKEQRTKAILSYWSSGIKTGAGNDNVALSKEGLGWERLTKEQKQILRKIIHIYASNVRKDQAKIDIEKIENNISESWFSFRKKDKGRLYFRVVHPAISIEFDELSGNYTDEDHVHSVIRSPNGNDYGASWLEKHLDSNHLRQR